MKKNSIRYFRLLSDQSRAVGSLKFLPRAFSPALHSHSDNVPTGHIQLQKPLPKRKAERRMVERITKPAGGTGSTLPVTRKYFMPISAPMGRNASIPGGLSTNLAVPPDSQYSTNR